MAADFQIVSFRPSHARPTMFSDCFDFGYPCAGPFSLAPDALIPAPLANLPTPPPCLGTAYTKHTEIGIWQRSPRFLKYFFYQLASTIPIYAEKNLTFGKY
jgi:hypothetical protein